MIRWDDIAPLFKAEFFRIKRLANSWVYFEVN
jgi:hypothetical protein